MQAEALPKFAATPKAAQNGPVRTIPPLSPDCKRIVSISDNDDYYWDSIIAHGRLQSAIDVIAKLDVASLALR
jgi:hypothetical protein